MIDLSPQNVAILKKHVAAENSFDMDATLATLTEDCLFEDIPSGRAYRGREAVRTYYREWWDAFRNVATGSQRYVPSPDLLIVETHFIGTHGGVFEGLKATGRKIRLPLTIFVSFRDGLMSGERFYYDRSTLIAQISAEAST